MVSSNDFLSQTTLVLDAGENLDFLRAKLNQVGAPGQSAFARMVIATLPGQKTKILAKLPDNFFTAEVVEIQSLRLDLYPLLRTPFLAYLPANAPYSPPQSNQGSGMEKFPLFIQPWVPLVNASDTEWARGVYLSLGWISTPALLQKIGLERSLSLRELERIARATQPCIPYFSQDATEPRMGEAGLVTEPPKLNTLSKIAVLIPYFKCEEWLEQCLDSMVRQTRPPEAIVVLDDASPQPPLGIVKKFPTVTLMRSPENGGPYRLIQSLIDQTQFDGYMFQDADDWSSLDRLELLLKEAERTGAEWIGTQELLIFEDVMHAVRYPPVLNGTGKINIKGTFSHPTSLVSRDLIARLGGFASGMRFSGDFEFFERSVWAGKAVNVDRYGYFRRIRKDSLTTAESTGFASTARKEWEDLIQNRFRINQNRVSKGQPPLLEPLKTAPTIRFEHLAGPPLVMGGSSK